MRRDKTSRRTGGRSPLVQPIAAIVEVSQSLSPFDFCIGARITRHRNRIILNAESVVIATITNTMRGLLDVLGFRFFRRALCCITSGRSQKGLQGDGAGLHQFLEVPNSRRLLAMPWKKIPPIEKTSGKRCYILYTFFPFFTLCRRVCGASCGVICGAFCKGVLMF